MVLKSVHSHDFVQQKKSIQHSLAIDKVHENCAICQFEFVNFIAATSEKQRLFQKSTSLDIPIISFHLSPKSFFCFQHRAPPYLV